MLLPSSPVIDPATQLPVSYDFKAHSLWDLGPDPQTIKSVFEFILQFGHLTTEFEGFDTRKPDVLLTARAVIQKLIADENNSAAQIASRVAAIDPRSKAKSAKVSRPRASKEVTSADAAWIRQLRDEKKTIAQISAATGITPYFIKVALATPPKAETAPVPGRTPVPIHVRPLGTPVPSKPSSELAELTAEAARA